MRTGTSIPHIRGKQIKSYVFLRPPIGDNRIFNYFEEIVAPLTKQVDAVLGESELLIQLRDTLLPKLISGELPIPDAEKLLEGVR